MHGRRLDPSICTHPSRARHQDMAPIVLERTVDAPLRAVFAPRRQLAHVGKNRGEMSHVENLRPNTQTKREKHRQYEVICRATGTDTDCPLKLGDCEKALNESRARSPRVNGGLTYHGVLRSFENE